MDEFIAKLKSSARSSPTKASRKACANRLAKDSTNATHQLVANPALGMFFVQQHVRKNVPKYIERQGNMQQQQKEMDLAVVEVEECTEIVKDMTNIESFTNILQSLEKLNSGLEEALPQQRKKSVLRKFSL